MPPPASPPSLLCCRAPRRAHGPSRGGLGEPRLPTAGGHLERRPVLGRAQHPGVLSGAGTCASLADDDAEVDGRPVGLGRAAVGAEAVGLQCPDPLRHLRVGEGLGDGVPHGLHPLLLLLVRVGREAAGGEGGEGGMAPGRGQHCRHPIPSLGSPEDPVGRRQVEAPAVHLLDVPHVHLDVGDANALPIVLGGEGGGAER